MKMIYSEQGANSRYWQTLLTLTSVFLALVIAANLTSHVSSVCFKQNDAEVRNLFSEIEKLKGAFEFVERSTLDIELCKAKLPTMRDQNRARHLFKHPLQSSTKDAPKDMPKSPVKPVQASRKDAPKDTPKSPVKPEETLDPDAELAKLELELEKVNRYPEETSGWDHGL
jgi:hypothetical protein